jgi:hypothetical protein
MSPPRKASCIEDRPLQITVVSDPSSKNSDQYRITYTA